MMKDVRRSFYTNLRHKNKAGIHYIMEFQMYRDRP